MGLGFLPGHRHPLLAGVVLTPLLFGPISAEAVDGDLSYATTNGGPVFDCPAGDAPAYPAGTLTVHLLDGFGQPEPGIPAEDIFLEWEPGTDLLPRCAAVSSFMADGPTDADGITTFSGPFATGGWGTMSLRVRYQGELTVIVIVQTGIEIETRNADINGDLSVNLADLGDFAAAFAAPGVSPAADLNGDGTRNLQDVYVFSQHFGHTCP